MADPTVFVSYSSEDRRFAASLIAELKRLGVEVWDYTGDPIPEGHSIPVALRTRIERCEWFIVVLTSSSSDPVRGRFVQAEVQLAVERTGGGDLPLGHLLPIVLSTSQPRHRGCLDNISSLEANPDEKASFERLIIRLCNLLGVHYQASILGDRWLGLPRRLQSEVEELQVSANESIRMILAIHSIGLHFARQEWNDCERRIRFLELFCEELSVSVPYFALVIEGTCQHWSGDLDKAAVTLRRATERSEAEENSYFGLGQVCFDLGRYDDALTAFKRALEKAAAYTGPGSDTFQLMIRFNILAVRIQLGVLTEDDSFLGHLKLQDLPPEDQTSLLRMKGLAYSKKGRHAEAVAQFADLDRQGLLDSATVLAYGNSLLKLSRRNEAERLLEEKARHFQDVNLHHYLADVLWNERSWDRALKIYDDVLSKDRSDRRRQFLTEFARMLEATGKQTQARAVCEMQLRESRVQPPRTQEDFYYDGLANYLLGRQERARYDFERSEGFLSVYYDALILRRHQGTSSGV